MLDKQKHETYMKQIIKSIFMSKAGNFLGFKGGTLSYLVHGLDRFSTDVDLDLLDISKEQELIKILDDMLLLLGDIKDKKLGKLLHRWVFRYDEAGMNIKVEINKRNCEHNTYELILIEDIMVNCMAKDSIFANKLVALSNRFANRDLYDVYFFFKNKFPLNEKIVYERTGLKIKDLCKQLIKELPKKYSEKTILHNLGNVLTDKQKIRAKKHLLKEVITYLKALVRKA